MLTGKQTVKGEDRELDKDRDAKAYNYVAKQKKLPLKSKEVVPIFSFFFSYV